MKEIEKLIGELKVQINEVNDLEGLKQLKSIFLYKSKFLNELREQIKVAEKLEIPELGGLINHYTKLVNEIFLLKKNQIENNFFIDVRVNPLLNNQIPDVKFSNKTGHIHPLTQIAFSAKKYLSSLNFSYKFGSEVENEEYNFTFLNMPKHHPARDMQDTLYLKRTGYLLRTHATNTTARKMVESKSNVIKSYSIGNVFRNDDNDATHSFQFNQIDFFATGGLSIANLKWTIDGLLEAIFEKKMETRYRPSFFPFTEPSYEVDIKCPNCKGKGCSVCSNSGWIEVLGSGMLHPNVYKSTNKDIKIGYGFAAGIGVDRLAMIKWNILDIRVLYLNDIKILRQF